MAQRAALVLLVLAEARAATPPARQLTLANASEWAFVGAPWATGPWRAGVHTYDSVMHANASSKVNFFMATHTAAAWADLDASVDFCFKGLGTAAALVLRSRGAADYFTVSVLEGFASQYEYMPVLVTHVDASGWARVLHTVYQSGVSSACCGFWHTLTVSVRGGSLSAAVDGFHSFSLVLQAEGGGGGGFDRAGYVGLATSDFYSDGDPEFPMAGFRNLAVKGAPAAAPPFDRAQRSAFSTTWRAAPAAVVNTTRCDAPGTGGMARMPSGDIVFGRHLCPAIGSALIATSDWGRTWRKIPPSGAGDPSTAANAWFRNRPLGRNVSALESFTLAPAHTFPYQIYKHSTVDGVDWSAARLVKTITAEMVTAAICTGIPPSSPERAQCLAEAKPGYTADWCPQGGGLVELPSGTLLAFLSFNNNKFGIRDVNSRRYWLNDNAYIGVGTVIRSTDGGESWSDPINMDATAARFVGKNASAFTRLFSVVNEQGQGQGEWLGAPVGAHGVYAHTQNVGRAWAAHSADEGLTWLPMARGSVYSAAEAAFTTAAGVLLESGRVPSQGLHVSYDEGKSWETYIIDAAGTMSNGGFAEVAPGIVLYGYGGTYHFARPNATEPNGDVRFQLLHVDAARRRVVPIAFDHPRFDELLAGDLSALYGAAPARPLGVAEAATLVKYE